MRFTGDWDKLTHPPEYWDLRKKRHQRDVDENPDEERPNTCEGCGVDLDSLRVALYLKANDQRQFCGEDCLRAWLQQRQQERKPERGWRCPACNQEFEHLRQAREHTRTHGTHTATIEIEEEAVS